MSKHTPGPWTPVKWDDNTSVQFDFSVCAGPNDHRVRVATCHYLSYGDIKVDPEANARLIAAAPELLRECQFALEMLKGEERSSVLASMGYRNFVHRLTEVIAKATGGADE